jgi:hypothetical protein
VIFVYSPRRYGAPTPPSAALLPPTRSASLPPLIFHQQPEPELDNTRAIALQHQKRSSMSHAGTPIRKDLPAPPLPWRVHETGLLWK